MTVENSKAEQTVDDAAPHELALVRSLETASGIYLTQDDGGREGAGLALLAVVEISAAKGLMPEHYSSIQRVALALRGLDNGEEIDPILKRRVTGRRKQRATLAIRGYIAAAMEAAIRFTSTNEQAAKWVADRIKGTPIAFQSRISTQTWIMVQE